MSESRGPLKAALLVAPLVTLILAFHGWGDGAASFAASRMDHWRYPEWTEKPFVIRAPRSLENAEWVRTLLNRFPEDSIQNYGALLDLRKPTVSAQVVLLESDGLVRRLGGDRAELLKENESLFDADRRAVVVRLEPKIDLTLAGGALRRGLARLMLHDAGSDRWSPWLTEGLVGLLEGSRATDLKASPEELPPLEMLLSAHETDFRGRDGALFSRAARLLVAWLHESFPEEFAQFCRAARAEGQARLSRYVERFADPLREQQAWREWIQGQK